MLSLEKVLKEILPIYSRYMTLHISELPVDVSSKIASYYLGDPKYMKLKHSKGLRKIQKKFKPYYTEVNRDEYEYSEQMPDYSEVDMKGVVFRYKLIQGECVKPAFYYIKHQYKKIKNIIDKEKEKQLNQNYDLYNIHFHFRRKYQDDREYDERNLDEDDIQGCWCVENNLKEIIERRQYIETKLYTDDDEGAVVSSYNISIGIEFIRRE